MRERQVFLVSIMTTTNEAKNNDNDNKNGWNKSIISLEQWIKLKKENIWENELITILNTMYNECQANSGPFSKSLIKQLKQYHKDNIVTTTLFIDYVLNELNYDYQNQSKLIDLYLELLTLKLQILNNNDLAYEKFMSDENILYKKNKWTQSEAKFDVLIPNLMDTFTKSQTIVASISSHDVQTIIKITKHAMASKPVYYLTIECNDYKINQ